MQHNSLMPVRKRRQKKEMQIQPESSHKYRKRETEIGYNTGNM